MNGAKDEDRLLLNALLDGELDAKGALEIERRVAEDSDLAAERKRISALRGALKLNIPREAAPATLRARLVAASAPGTKPRIVASGWRGYGAAIAATIALTLGADRLALRYGGTNPVLESVVAAHMRAQISGAPTDVASSDRHTVKPWLAAKIPVDSFVVDLASEGYPLLGGRVDIVNGAAAPTLVYKRREHLVSITQLPEHNRNFLQEPRLVTQAGYPVVLWSEAGRVFVVVSDLAPAELRAFSERFREAVEFQQANKPE
ncbi:MAG TPA: hypothetical protein VK446_06460 [Methylocystis sp.]|nr:hypothetical protein [Methylocystis sp.]